jgi:hypothetical protein
MIHRCRDATTRPMKWGVAHLLISACEREANSAAAHGTHQVQREDAPCNREHAHSGATQNVSHESRSVQHAMDNTQDAPRNMQHTPSATYNMHHAAYTVLYASVHSSHEQPVSIAPIRCNGEYADWL